MKNSTKIRLHLSKQLFESLTRQVIAESKKGDMSGGAYTEAVKTPKGEKKADKEVKTETKPATSKSASKQQVGVDLVNKGRNLAKDTKANVQSAEGGKLSAIVSKLIDLADNPDNASVILDKVSRVLDQSMPKDNLPAPPKEERSGGPFFEMETITAEKKGKVEEDEMNVANPMHYVTNPGLVAATEYFGYLLLAGLGSALGLGIWKDVAAGKKPKQAVADAKAQVDKLAAQGDEKALKVQQMEKGEKA